MQVQIILTDKSIEISEFNRKKLRQAVKDNGRPIKGYISTTMPESRKQRGYLMGGLIPLLVYLDGNDYKDKDMLDFYFQEYKKELQPEFVTINGTPRKRGKSTKGSESLNQFIEKLQEFLAEQYGIDHNCPAINPEEYKKFRDEIYFDSEYEDFISYAVDMKWIKR